MPLLWPGLRDSEKWNVGLAYATAYDAGEVTVSAGLKKALLKVKGFDYVPENLRSHTFVKAAERLIEAHEGMNNFYNETRTDAGVEVSRHIYSDPRITRLRNCCTVCRIRKYMECVLVCAARCT